ncbi:MAG TPA: glycosyltransferase family 4 protein [Methylomirabilota bacterium]|nr:glycosyltransferase family 4 protein [Methylomirabilota bacterium]
MKSNGPLRVALYDPSGHGGICHYTYQLATSLARWGADVTVVTTEGYELRHLERNFKLKPWFRKSRIKSLAANILARLRGNVFSNSHGRSARRPLNSSADRKVVGFLKRLRLRCQLYKGSLEWLLRRPDIVHVQWLIDCDGDYDWIRLLKLFGIKIVYTAHDLLPNTNPSLEHHWLLGRIYRKVDAIVVHGEASKDEMVSVFGLDPAKIYVIPHGSNELVSTNRQTSKQAAREKLGIGSAHRVILFFGIIKPYKGLEYLVQAFEEVKTQVRNSLLLVVGGIYDGDAEAFHYYADLIDQIRRRDDVLCVPHYIPFEKISDYFCAADLVVLPYTKTYTSGVLLAAYAAGRPVVATDTGALKEAVETGRSGLVVPPKDAKALSRAIVEIFNRRDIEEMGRYAKHLAETKYSWTGVALKTSELYRSLAA